VIVRIVAAPWRQDFDFYLVEIEERPASFVVDLAASAHAPLASHPVRIDGRVPMLRPRPDGLRDASELDALGELEDVLARRLGDSVDAIYVGRAVFAGHTILHFYAPAAVRGRQGDLPDLVGTTGEYRPSWAVHDDAGWSVYLEVLTPDPYEHATIWNRRLLRAFEDRGDHLDRARPIDHFAFFPDLTTAERARIALEAKGFATEPVVPPLEDGDAWALTFHRADVLAGGRPDPFCAEILDIVLPEGGDYDGWGAPDVRD
jgi:hypothetical protein